MFGAAQDRLDVLERDLQAIIEDDPDHADALNALGYTLADQTDRYQEALGYIERALALKPDNAAILDSMGWVLFRLGRNEEALEYLRRALDAGFDGEIAAHLGEVLWVTGDRKAAREVWQEALERDPDNEFVLETMERLD
jgi:tetratricopeptide (TPR) repeat protein